MDFLEVTAPILYRRVEITSLDLLKLLFCSREEQSVSSHVSLSFLHASSSHFASASSRSMMLQKSRIDDTLSLFQTRTLNLDLSSVTNDDASILPSTLPLFTSRLNPPIPIPLDLLRVTTLFDSGSLFALLFITLLPHLNPTQFDCNVRQRTDTSPEFYLGGSKLPILSHFTRLQTISLQGIIPFTFQKAAPLGAYSLCCLPSPALDCRRNLRLHLPSLLHPGCFSVGKWVRNLDRWKDVLGFSGMQEGSIVLVVWTDEERKEVERVLEEEVEETWKSLYVVEEV